MSIVSGVRDLLGIKKDAVEKKKTEMEIAKLEEERIAGRLVEPSMEDVKKYDPKTRDLIRIIDELEGQIEYCFMEESNADQQHCQKRFMSFVILDYLLDQCENACCPVIDLTNHDFLIDISAEGYINERAYFYSIKDIGTDDKDRYYMALLSVRRIFECTKKPKLMEDVFEWDAQQLEKDQAIADCAKRRKAYWSYLKFRPNNNSYADYYDACQFLETVLDAYHRRFDPEYDLRKLGDFLLSKLYLANGIDLLRFCFIRQCLIEVLQ